MSKPAKASKADLPKSQSAETEAQLQFRFRLIHLIFAALGIAILVAVLLLVFLRPWSQSTTSRTNDWIDRYYKHLGQIIEDSHEYEGNLYTSDLEDAQVAFYDLERWESPVMAISYKDKRNDGEARTEYMMISDGKSVFMDEPARYQIKHFYNMLEGTDDYYVTYDTDETQGCYQPLRGMIASFEHPDEMGQSICVHNQDTTENIIPGATVITEQGDTLLTEYQPFDKVFLTLEDYENSFSLTIGMTADELRRVYDEVIGRLEDDVRKSHSELADIDQRVNDAREKIAAKVKAAEESQKQTAEQAGNASDANSSSNSGGSGASSSKPSVASGGNGIMVGNDLVKYGTYMRLDPNDGVSDQGGRLYLRSDGSATLTRGGTTESYPRYQAENYGFTQDGYNVTYSPAIVFYDAQGRQAYALYYSGGVLKDLGTGMYKWIGE